MQDQPVVPLAIFAGAIVLYSMQLWTNPRRYLRRRRSQREWLYKSPIGFLARSPWNRGLDRHPGRELLVARGTSLDMLFLLALVGFTTLRSSLS